MVKVNVSRTQFSLSIAISVALTPNLRKLNFSQISQRMSESFEYVGPDLVLNCRERHSTFLLDGSMVTKLRCIRGQGYPQAHSLFR